MRRSMGSLLLLILSLQLLGCGDDKARAASNQQSENKKRQVKVVRAEETSLARIVAVTGTLQADEEVTLALKVAGRVAEIMVDLGSFVKRGQPLARLESTDFNLRVQQAQAALEQARARLGLEDTELRGSVNPEETGLVKQAAAVLEQSRLTKERMTSLHEQGLISKSQYDDALAAYRVAEARYQDAVEEVQNREAVLGQRSAELQLARKQLSDSVLVAPIDGAIQERLISRGQFLAAGDPAFRLVSSHILRLRLAVPERESTGIRKGQRVLVHVEGDPTAYPGTLARISPGISRENRTLIVEAEVPNQNGLLRPGSFARAEIIIESRDKAIVVPANAVVTFAGIHKVITVKGDTTEEKRVVIGRKTGDGVEIVEGLTVGDVVVTNPGNLVGGEKVQPVR